MTLQQQKFARRRGKGQTLVEFAITFPILLILMFGIIEFGRIFQAWVTLQNSARVAARYATTGQYNSEKYPINIEGLDDEDSVVPCVLDDMRGSAELEFDEYLPEGVQVYKGLEGLYATWYQGEDCQPNVRSHQERREDLVRILSIFDEAYVGAAGLALAERGSEISPATFDDESVPVGAEYTSDSFDENTDVPWYQVWVRPDAWGDEPPNTRYSGFDERAYFDVMICSGRGPENGGPGELDVPISRREYGDPADPTNPAKNIFTRFATVLDGSETAVGEDARYAPACLLNEQSDAADSVDNTGVPWIDAGGPGDPITIVITFNHPLITPLGLSPYLQLQARRTAVNESFREAESVTSLPFPSPSTGGSPGGEETGTPTEEAIPEPRLDVVAECELDGTYRFSVTNIGDVAMFNPENYIVYDSTGTTLQSGQIGVLNPDQTQVILQDGFGLISIRVDPPDGSSTQTVPIVVSTTCVEETVSPDFDCDLIEIPLVAGSPRYGMNGADFQVEWVNNNVMATRLLSVTLNWQEIPTYPGMLPSQMSMARATYWINQESASPDPITVDETTQGYFPGATPVLLSGVRNLWAVTFGNGPARLSEFLSPYAFNGTSFTFENPQDAANPCVRALDIAPPTITPTLDPGGVQPTSTPTPDCAPGRIQVTFDRFDIFGVVRVRVNNRRNIVATMTGFNINWIQRDLSGDLYLSQVRVGGSNPETGTLVWSSGAARQDNQPSTRGSSSGGGEGVWNLNYNFPPNSETYIWLDFNGGVGSSQLDTAYLASLSDYNGSSFTFLLPVCQSGGQGGGVIGTEDVTPNAQNTPRPTNTSAPPATRPNWTNTPRPPTQTPRPPTATPIVPTNPPPTVAPTNPNPQVTIIFGGGGGGSD